MERLVGIKHPYCSKTYWFSAPEYLGEIKVGDICLCDTSFGDSVGKVVSEPIIAENISDIAVQFGATLPLKNIKQVCGATIRDYIIVQSNRDLYSCIQKFMLNRIYKHERHED